MNRTVWIGAGIAVLARVFSANPVVAEEDIWKKRYEVASVFSTMRHLNEAILKYAMSADKLPAKASDLPKIYKKFPALPLAWHGKPVTVQVYDGELAKVVSLKREGRRGVTFTINLDALKDTGQIMYATGEAAIGDGPKRPYAVMWFDCTHDKGEFDIRMCAGGVVKISFGRSGRSRWIPIMETERFRVENQNATPAHVKAVSGAVSIHYGNEEGVHPATLDDLVPIYRQSIPARRHLTYDPLTGKVGARRKKEHSGRR